MDHQFTGQEGEFISLEQAQQFTRSYRESQQFELNNGIKAHFYGREKLLKILGQDGCMGIRIYYGAEDGTPNLVLIGVDTDMNDQTDGQLIENSRPCPTFCGLNNLLQ